MNEQLNTYLYPFSLTLLFTISCIISFKRKTRDPRAGIFLALMYWSYFYALLIGYLGETGYIIQVPHLIRTGQIATLLFMPMSFLYISRTFNPRPWKWTDWLHLLPIFFYVIDFSVFFLKPASEKVAIYKDIYGTTFFSAFSEGLFTPKWFHIFFRYILMFVYWVVQFIFLRKAIAARDLSAKDNQPSLFIWLQWLTFTQLILIVPPLINLIFRIEKFWVVAQFSGIFGSFVQGYFLLKKPEILYGLEPTFKMEDFQVSNAAMPLENAKNNTPITDQRKLELLKGIIEKLESHFCINKPYLKQGYGLADLSIELGCTTHLLSYMINKHYGMNFYSLINQFRIEACKEKLKLGEYQQKTLEAIAHESGFQNRGTFIRAFKNSTGTTPSDFIRDLS